MIRFFISLFISFFFGYTALQGQTLVLQPEATAGKDAVIRINDATGADGNTNFSGDASFQASRYQVSTNWNKSRSLIYFNLSQIPKNAVIISANLYLYGTGQHITTGQTNAALLQKIAAPWNEQTVTWNNQPAVAPAGALPINSSTTANQNYTVDVLKHVQDMVINPNGNFGWMISLQGESNALAATLAFASSDYTVDPTKRPKLEIKYLSLNFNTTQATGPTAANGAIALTVKGGTAPFTYLWSTGATTQNLSGLLPGAYTVTVTDAQGGIAKAYAFVGSSGTAATVSIQPDPALGKDASILKKVSSDNLGDANNGTLTEFRSLRGTVSGIWYSERGLIEFNLSSIPATAIITSAQLNLFGLNHASTSQPNASQLLRVLQPWHENTVTFNEQPTTSNSGAVAIPASTTATQDYNLNVTASVQDMVRYPAANFGWQIRLDGENNNLYGRLIFASSDYTITPAKRPSLQITYYVPTQETGKNWVSMETFDENGNSNGQMRTYMDALGRTTQVQTDAAGTSEVVAVQNVFDAYGRPSLQTLPAALYQGGVAFKNNFITNTSGQNYSYVDFDLPNTSANTAGQINNPKPIAATTQGSLGWYYSNNNTDEPYVAASAFPYSRVEYYNDPSHRAKRTAKAGENHRMGSGNEQEYFYLSNAGELYYAFGYKGSAIVGLENTATNLVPSENLNAYKGVVVDADGKVFISYTTASGLEIASCRSGMQTGGCIAQKVSQAMVYKGERAISIHLPASKTSTLQLPVSANAVGNGILAAEGSGTNPVQINYTITDLRTGKVLVPGASGDYTLNRSTRQVVFSSAWQNKHLFLRIAFEYAPTVTFNTYNIPDLYVVYELDYDYWGLNYYDAQGKLVRSVPPTANNCTYDPTLTNSQILGYNERAIPLTTAPSLITYTTPYTAGYDRDVIVSINEVAVTSNPNANQTQTVSRAVMTTDNALGDRGGIVNVVAAAATASGGSTARQNVELDPSLERHTADFNISFEICGKNGSSITVIQPGEFYLPGTIYYTDISTGSITYFIISNAYGNDLSFNLAPASVNPYGEILLRITQVRVTTSNNGSWLPYNAGQPGSEESVLINALIQTKKLGISSTISRYPTPTPSYTNQHMTYEYDQRGRLLRKNTPDEGLVNFIYDNEYKPRFTQNAVQAAASGKFTYYAYDIAGRIIETGEYDPALAPSNVKLVFQPYGTGGTVPAAPATGVSIHSIVNNTGWNYAAYSSQQEWVAYDKTQTDFPATLTGYNQTYKDNAVAKAWNANSKTWYGYDHAGRMLWKVQDVTGLGIKTVKYVYDVKGKLQQMRYQDEVPAERFIHAYTYDRAERIAQTKTSFDGINYTLNEQVRYYRDGNTKRRELHTDLQGMDYVYTINGWLKSVNEPTLTNRDPGKDSYAGTNLAFKKDAFGFTLDYFSGDYVRRNTLIETYTPSATNTAYTDQYNGSIRSMRWQTQTPTAAAPAFTGMLQYTYLYDNQGQLNKAIFGTVVQGTINNATTGTSPVFTEKTDYLLDNISYDKNGNIKTLKRNGTGNATNLPMDNFTYNYQSTLPNRLLQVTDAVVNSVYNDDIETQAAGNYVYNAIGQLITDNGSKQSYKYNKNGKATEVKSTNAGNPLLMKIDYDEAGRRLRKTSYNASGVATKYLWYIYDAGGALLSTYETVISTAVTTQKDLEVYSDRRIGMYERGTSSYIYELKDHLGNVRATIRKNGANAEVLSYTDYYPHGGALPGRNYIAANAYRFAYQGQEKDVETGLLNFELRMLDTRLGRWFAPDPYGQYYSPYVAMGNNPGNMIDPDGGYSNWSGDDFFATDRYQASQGDWVSNADRVQRYFDGKESFHISVKRYLENRLEDFRTGFFEREYSYARDENGKLITTSDGHLTLDKDLRSVNIGDRALIYDVFDTFFSSGGASLDVKMNEEKNSLLDKAKDAYNSDVDKAIGMIGTGADLADAAATLTVVQDIRLAQRGLDLTADAAKFAKFANVAGKAANGLAYVNAGYQLATGHDNTSTWVDVGVTTVGIVTVGIVGVAAAPFVAVGGLLYGVWSLAGGSDWIDENWGYR